MINLSCPDWEQRLREGRSLIPDLQLPNAADGERAVRIFDKLKLFDVPGTPSMQDAAGDWFRQIVRVLFASLDPVTKARLIRELFLLVPKKNNKTTGGALLMLTALLMNERPRAPFLLTGPVQKTADDAFAAAAGAIALDPVLERRLHVRDHLKTIVDRQTQARLEIMTFDPDIVTGKKVVGALIDEHHVLGKMARANKAMVQLRGGMVPFPEAFLVIITTQSDEAPAGVFKQDLTKAREIRDGKRQGQMLPVLYEFPRAMQTAPDKPWRDPANWHLVTPNIGRSVALETLINGCADEEAKGEADLRTWASQHLNIEIGLALHSDRWAGADYWEAQTDDTLTLPELLRRSEVVVVGVDGGGLDDLLGLSVLGREAGTGNWLQWFKAWAARSVLERRKSEAARLEDFAKDGDLVLVDRVGEDVAQLAEVVLEVYETGLLAEIGLDPEKTHKVVLQALVDAGIPEELVKGVSQGWRLVGAITMAERKLAQGALFHADQPLMLWCVGNAKVEPRGNAVLITKQASGTAKIDPLMAGFNAVHLMALNPEGPSTMSNYLKFLAARQAADSGAAA